MSALAMEFNNLSLKREEDSENHQQQQQQRKTFNASLLQQKQQQQQHQSLLNIFLDDLQLQQPQLQQQPNNDYIMDDYIEKIGTRINLLETELKFAWRALDLLSNEYSKIWLRLEKLENITIEQQTVVTHLLDLVVNNNNNNNNNKNKTTLYAADNNDLQQQLLALENEVILGEQQMNVQQEEQRTLLDFLLQDATDMANGVAEKEETRQKLYSDSEVIYAQQQQQQQNYPFTYEPALRADFSLLSKAHSLNQLSLGERLATCDKRLYRTNSALNTEWSAEMSLSDNYGAIGGIEHFFHPRASKLLGRRQTMPIQDTGGGLKTDLFSNLKQVPAADDSRAVVAELNDMERLLQQSEEDEKSYTNSNVSINLTCSLNIIQEQEEIDEQQQQQQQQQQINKRQTIEENKKKKKKKKKQYKNEMEIFNNLKNSLDVEGTTTTLATAAKTTTTTTTKISTSSSNNKAENTDVGAEILAKILQIILNEISKIKHLKPISIEQKQQIAHILCKEQVFFEKLYKIDKNLVQLLLNPITLSDQLKNYRENEMKKFEIIQEKLKINIETIKKLLGGRNSFEKKPEEKQTYKEQLTACDEYAETLKRHNSNLDEQLKLIESKELQMQKQQTTTEAAVATSPKQKLINFTESDTLTRQLLNSASQTNLYNSDAYVQELKKNLERHNSMLLLLHLQQQHKQQHATIAEEIVNINMLEQNLDIEEYSNSQNSPPPPAPNNDDDELAVMLNGEADAMEKLCATHNPFLYDFEQQQQQQQQQSQYQAQSALMSTYASTNCMLKLLNNNAKLQQQQQQQQHKCDSLLSTTSGFSSSWERSSNSSMELSFDATTTTTTTTTTIDNTLFTTTMPYLIQQQQQHYTKTIPTLAIVDNTTTTNKYQQNYAENFNYLRELSTNMPISSAFEQRTKYTLHKQQAQQQQHQMYCFNKKQQQQHIIGIPDLLKSNAKFADVDEDFLQQQQQQQPPRYRRQQHFIAENNYFLQHEQQQRYYRSLSAGSAACVQSQQQQQRKSTNLTDYLAFYPTSQQTKNHTQQQKQQQASTNADQKQQQQQQQQYQEPVKQNNDVSKQNFSKITTTTDYGNQPKQEQQQLHKQQQQLNLTNSKNNNKKLFRKLSNFLPDTLKKSQQQHYYQRSHSLPMGDSVHKIDADVDDDDDDDDDNDDDVDANEMNFFQNNKKHNKHQGKSTTSTVATVLKARSVLKKLGQQRQQQITNFMQKAKEKAKSTRKLTKTTTASASVSTSANISDAEEEEQQQLEDDEQQQHQKQQITYYDDDKDDDDDGHCDDENLSLASDFDEIQQQHQYKKINKKYCRKRQQKHQQHQQHTHNNEIAKTTTSDLFPTVGNLKQQQETASMDEHKQQEQQNIFAQKEGEEEEQKKDEINKYNQDTLPLEDAVVTTTTTTQTLQCLGIPTTQNFWYSSGGSGDESISQQQSIHLNNNLQRPQHQRSLSSSMSSRRQSTEDSIDTDDEYYNYELRQLQQMEYEQQQQRLELEQQQQQVQLLQQEQEMTKSKREVSNIELFSKIDQLIATTRDDDEKEEADIEKTRMNDVVVEQEIDEYVKQMMSIVLQELKFTVKLHPAHDEQLQKQQEQQQQQHQHQQRRKSSTTTTTTAAVPAVNHVTDMQKAWQDYHQDYAQQQQQHPQQQHKRYKKRRLIAQMPVNQLEDTAFNDEQQQIYSTDTEEDDDKEQHNKMKSKRKYVNKQKEKEHNTLKVNIEEKDSDAEEEEEIERAEEDDDRRSLSSVTTSGPDTPGILSETEEGVTLEGSNELPEEPSVTPSYANFRRSLKAQQQQDEFEKQRNAGAIPIDTTQHHQVEKQKSYINGSSLSTTSSIDSSAGGIGMNSKWKLLKTLKERKIEEKTNQNKIKEEEIQCKERDKVKM